MTPAVVWSEWGDWIETDPSSCSCGKGFKIRFRNCPAPSPDACDGDQTQTEPCTASESINQQTCEKPSGFTSGRFQWVSSSLKFLVWWKLKITNKLSSDIHCASKSTLLLLFWVHSLWLGSAQKWPILDWNSHTQQGHHINFQEGALMVRNGQPNSFYLLGFVWVHLDPPPPFHPKIKFLSRKHKWRLTWGALQQKIIPKVRT